MDLYLNRATPDPCREAPVTLCMCIFYPLSRSPIPPPALAPAPYCFAKFDLFATGGSLPAAKRRIIGPLSRGRLESTPRRSSIRSLRHGHRPVGGREGRLRGQDGGPRVYPSSCRCHQRLQGGIICYGTKLRLFVDLCQHTCLCRRTCSEKRLRGQWEIVFCFFERKKRWSLEQDSQVLES